MPCREIMNVWHLILWYVSEKTCHHSFRLWVDFLLIATSSRILLQAGYHYDLGLATSKLRGSTQGNLWWESRLPIIVEEDMICWQETLVLLNPNTPGCSCPKIPLKNMTHTNSLLINFSSNVRTYVNNTGQTPVVNIHACKLRLSHI